MSIDRAYDQWSRTYDSDRNLTRDLDGAVTPQLLASLRPAGGKLGRVVEAGCGTGKNTSAFAASAHEVLALDFSPGMLAQARARVTAGHVRFAEANLMQHWPCESASAALVSCNLVLEHIEALPPVFAEAARVLQPGGCLLVSELHPYKQYRGSQARFTSETGETVPVTAFRHHLSDFTAAAHAAGLVLEQLDEWWHDEDIGQPPRLITFRFRKPPGAASSPTAAAGVAGATRPPVEGPGVRVTSETPDHPEVAALVSALDAYQATLYPPESCYSLDLTTLAPEQVQVFLARDADGRALGCGALVLRERYGEVKRMYVRTYARGRGVASALLVAIESAARAAGRARLHLETGLAQPDAIGLYARAGFTRCGRFGDYPDNPLSVYLQKLLPVEPR